MTKTLDSRWVHLVCGLIATDYAESFQIEIPQKRRMTGPPEFLQLEMPQTALQMDCSKCWGGKEPMYTVTCSACQRQVHFSCFLKSPDWTYCGGFECGCRKAPVPPVVIPVVTAAKPHGTKKAKKPLGHDYEPIRAIFEEVVSLDEFRLFRTEAAGRPLILPEKLRKFVGRLTDTFLVRNSDEGLSCEVDLRELKPQSGGSKDYTVTKEVLLDLKKAENIVDADEPTHVADFNEYEDQLLVSLDFLYTYRVSEHYYFSIKQLITDLGKLMTNKLKLCRDREAEKYVNWFWQRATFSINKRKKEFEKAVLRDWKNLIDQSKGVPTVNPSSWIKRNTQKRSYTYIAEFDPVSGDLALLDRLKTSKVVGCSGAACSDISQLGPFDLATCTWKTQNECRSKRTECTDLCKCDPKRCQNRQLTKGDIKHLGEDVCETPTYGFDVLTYRTIMAYLRQPISDDMHVFIAKKLPKAINRVTTDSWDMRQAASLIISEQESLFTLKEKRYAQGLLNAIDGLTSLLDPEEVIRYFRIHPKGTGVVCTSKTGFKANELIVPYIGELYSPSKWYERQDVIKSLVKASKSYNGQLPDFYNIMLERHFEDPEGYDILMIDPIVKGTFGSRLSHSCTPNCGTVAMVADGRYTIGMYALENIEYGQELTFDYHSVTESAEEYSKAICLCAASVCRGHFLSLSKNSQSPEFFNEEHGFLARMACIVRGGNLALVPEDEALLSENHLKERAIGGTADWLKKWTAEILRAIIKETSRMEDEYERKNAYSWYLQNLVLSLDKVKHCLAAHQCAIGTCPPPLEFLSESDTILYLWSNDEGSVRCQLKHLYGTIFVDHKASVHSFLHRDFNDLDDIRMHLLQFRDFLRSMAKDEWSCQGVADILHLIAYTRFWVKQNVYHSFNSEEVAVRFCDITSTPPVGKTLDNIWSSDTRLYNATFIEGTLAGWFKQTVEKPSASLSADKRGTLCLPNLDSVVEGCSGNIYTPSMRARLLEHIQTRPQQPWPSKVKESEGKTSWNHYVNIAKVQGSPMLDSAILMDGWEHLKTCLREVDVPAECLRERMRSVGRLWG